MQLDFRTPPGFDRTRNAEIGNKDIKFKHLEEAFTSEHWLVRIYKVKAPDNRETLDHKPRVTNIVPKQKYLSKKVGVKQSLPSFPLALSQNYLLQSQSDRKMGKEISSLLHSQCLQWDWARHFIWSPMEMHGPGHLARAFPGSCRDTDQHPPLDGMLASEVAA